MNIGSANGLVLSDQKPLPGPKLTQIYFTICTGVGYLNTKGRLTSIWIPMLKIRRNRDRLVFSMGIPIHGKDSIHIETGPGTPAADTKLHISILF